MKDETPEFSQPWIPFHEEMADKLLAFKDNRGKLINIVASVYDETGIPMPKLEEDGKPRDIDPFTVFALFNKGITDQNRMGIMSAFKKLLNIGSPVPDKWDGVPFANNQKAAFYRFGDKRDEDDIDHLWEIFEDALTLADNPDSEAKDRFVTVYDQVISQKGIKWNITMGLYWIRPNTFLSLDQNNRNFLKSEKFWSDEAVSEWSPMLTNIPSGKEYLNFLQLVNEEMEDKHPSWSFPILSAMAFDEATKAKEKSNGDKNHNNLNSANIRWIIPLIKALKQLGGSATPKAAAAKVAENERLTKEELEAVRGKSQVNKFTNELAFARNILANAGYIDRTIRGIWTLTNVI